MSVPRRSSRTPAPRVIQSPLLALNAARARKRRRTQRHEDPSDRSALSQPPQDQRSPPDATLSARSSHQPEAVGDANFSPRRSARQNLGRPAARFEIPLHVPRPRQRHRSQTVLEESDEASTSEDGGDGEEVWVLPPAADPSRPLPDRHYLGPMTEVCPSCQALHWWEERSAYRHSGHNSTPYSLCCGKGSVDLRPIPPFPEELKDLFTGSGSGKYSLVYRF